MEEPKLKKCIECKERKPESAFYKNRKAKDGLQSRCKACDKKRSSTLGGGQ